MLNEALRIKKTQILDYNSLFAQVQGFVASQYASLVSNISAENEAMLKAYIIKYINDYQLAVNDKSTDELADTIYADMVMYGFLTKYLFFMPDVEEININRWDDVKITYDDGRIEACPESFASPRHASDTLKKMLRQSGIILDESNPSVRGHLNKNIRITALCRPLIDEDAGVTASIRLVNPKNFGKEDFLNFGTATEEMLDLLVNCLRYGISMALSGATGSGKTTLLAYLLSTIPVTKRIFTIENETREFNLVVRDSQGRVANNVIHTVTKDSDDPKQCVDTDRLLEIALTFNPDYICVAEMKGAESYTAQEAGRTGHTVLTTTHANDCASTYGRMVSLCKLKTSINEDMVMGMVKEAFPIVVYCKRLEDNSRKIMEITECYQDGREMKIHTLYRYQITEESIDADGRTVIHGHFCRADDISRTLAERLRENGMPPDMIARYYRNRE